MKKTYRSFLWLTTITFFLGACIATSEPQQLLNNMAGAMTKKDGAAFLNSIDMKAFAANSAKNMTRDDQALSALDSMGRMLGLGGVNNLLNDVLDIETKQRDQFMRGVSTGELMLQCSKATTPDCPWVPESLRQAKIVSIGDDAAIAQVTSPTNMTSWLALRKTEGGWKVTGQAVMESTAKEYAGQTKASTPEPSKPAPKQPAAPAPTKTPDQGVKNI